MDLDQFIPPACDDEEIIYVDDSPPPYHIAVSFLESRLQPSSPPPYSAVVAAVVVAAAAENVDEPTPLTAIDRARCHRSTSIGPIPTACKSNYRKQEMLATVALFIINPVFGSIALVLASKSIV